MNKSGSFLLRIGILFIFLGFGSLILNQFDMHFTLISWADDMQPVFGVILGLVGVAIVALPFVLRGREKTPQRPQFAQQPPQYGQAPYSQGGAAGQPLPGGPMPAQPQFGQPGQPPVPGAPQQPGQPG